jgi:cardiolipin synthase
MEVGIQIYEYQNGFLHSKVLIVDDEVLSIGTANMDLRSFNHNFEATAMIYHPPTVAKALVHFEADLTNSREVELSRILHKNILARTMESVCRLFSPVL